MAAAGVVLQVGVVAELTKALPVGQVRQVAAKQPLAPALSREQLGEGLVKGNGGQVRGVWI